MIKTGMTQYLTDHLNRVDETNGIKFTHEKEAEGTIPNYCFIKGKVIPRHCALGSHEGLYGQCLNLVSIVRSNLECSYTDSPGRLSGLRQSRVNEIA